MLSAFRLLISFFVALQVGCSVPLVCKTATQDALSLTLIEDAAFNTAVSCAGPFSASCDPDEIGKLAEQAYEIKQKFHREASECLR